MANTKAFLEGSFFSEKHGDTGTQSGEIGYNGRTEGWQESAGVGGHGYEDTCQPFSLEMIPDTNILWPISRGEVMRLTC